MKKYYNFFCGFVGYIVVLGLCLYQLSCLAVIFFTPGSGGQGDYYDATLDVEGGGNIIGTMFILLPLLLLFYPWLKLFLSMMLNRIRPDYYGLFIGKGKVTRLISVLLTILNVGTIIWFTCAISVESDRIYYWNYENALCPDNSVIDIDYILEIIAFWGIIHLVHGVWHIRLSQW